VLALWVSGSTVYAGGQFISIGGQSRNRIAALDAVSGLATAWNPSADNTVYQLSVSGSKVYAAGLFTSIGGQSRNRIAALDATSGLATIWNPNANNPVEALTVSGSTVYAGGDFTSVGGQSRNRIAALDATTGLATAWNPNANNDVDALAISGSTVYVCGDFSGIGGQTRIKIGAVDAMSGLATSWNPMPVYPGGVVNTLTVSGSTVYAGGSFTNVGGFPQSYFASIITASPPPVPSSLWHAQMNAYPDAVCPWVHTDTATPEQASLSGGVLTLSTSENAENMWYEQSSALAIPDTFVISARLRVASESHTDGNPRRGVQIAFTVGPDSANQCHVGRDTVFLHSAYGIQGPTAFVDTDDAPHTYTIKVVNHSAITVYHDNVPILTGAIVISPNYVDYPDIYWGDGTGNASAVSEWTFFRHNGGTVQCGTPVDVPSGPALDSNSPLLSLVAYPNPSGGPIVFAIRSGISQTKPARVRVYDISGRLVRSIEAGSVSAGLTRLDWDGTDDVGRSVASGTYFWRLESEGREVGTSKITLLR
jgi:hypothetical protein